MTRQPTYELTHCPVCDSLESVEVADAEAMRAEVEQLWAFHEGRLRAGVPPDQLVDRLAFSQRPPVRLGQCTSCTHLYRNPWERKEALKAAYADASPELEVLQTLFETQRGASQAQVHRLTAVAGRAGRGLEVGSYAGGFLEASREAGWSFEGVDVNEAAAEFAGRKGLAVTRGEIGDVASAQPFDAIAIWNTFEQLYDTREALLAARRLLRDDGVLAIRLPNGGFYVRWRRRLQRPVAPIALRLLAHNNLLSFPYRQGFTRPSLAKLLESCGFRITKSFGDTLVTVANRWTTGYGAMEERVVKWLQRLSQTGWSAPWVEIYAKKVGG